MRQFQGAFTALITPFKDGAIDFDALDNLVNSQIADGLHGLVPCGTTGEAATLSFEEHISVVKRVVKTAKGRVPVIAGIGSPATATSVQLAKACAEAGVTGLLAVTPYYNRPNALGLYQHFLTVAQSTKLPIILYNVPGRTGVDLPPDVTVRLSETTNIVGLKDATGNLQRQHEMILQLPPHFSMLSGEDGIVLPTLSIGGAGVISVITHVVGAPMSKLCNAYLGGKLDEAKQHAARTLPFARLLFMDTNPIPVKTALAAMGMIREEWRLPLGPMPADKRTLLISELKRLGVDVKNG